MSLSDALHSRALGSAEKSAFSLNKFTSIKKQSGGNEMRGRNNAVTQDVLADGERRFGFPEGEEYVFSMLPLLCADHGGWCLQREAKEFASQTRLILFLICCRKLSFHTFQTKIKKKFKLIAGILEFGGIFYFSHKR